ncbi:MAG TPA: efflux RND transporter periplasmic adaptor subunit [Drouetiella sp.]
MFKNKTANADVNRSEVSATGATSNSGSKPKSRKGLMIVVALVLIAAVATAVYFYMQQNQSGDWKKNAVLVKRGTVDMQIIATGTIKPISEIKVSPKSTGQIKRLYVQQGDVVKENQILAQMDDSNLLGSITAAKGTLAMAQDNYAKISHGNRPQEVAIARLSVARANNIVKEAEHNVIRLKANLDSLKQQVVRDETNASRVNYLETQGAISDQDRLNADTTAKMTHAQMDAAKRELAQAEETLAQNKVEWESAGKQHELSRIGNRDEDVRAAKDAVLQAKGNLETLEAEQRDTTIRAPFAGVITQKYADTGAIVTPTTSAATTSATSSSIVALAGELELVAQVAETDISKIEIGQPVEVISNAYPDKKFHGEVTQIAPEAVVTQNVTTFEVHTTVEDPKHRLLSGMNVSARFVAGKMDNVILVPTVCVVSRHGKTGVLLASKDGAPQFKGVKIGPTVGTETAILRGLHDGDYVFKGLNKEQLDQQGYGSDRPPGGPGSEGGRRGGHGGGGGGGGAPVPRGLGR